MFEGNEYKERGGAWHLTYVISSQDFKPLKTITASYVNTFNAASMTSASDEALSTSRTYAEGFAQLERFCNRLRIRSIFTGSIDTCSQFNDGSALRKRSLETPSLALK